jgi:hypothetical protein
MIFVPNYMVNMKIMIITISLIHKIKIPMTRNFEELVYGWFFKNRLYGPPWRISKAFPIIWSSLDNYKDNSKNNYFISKSNYFISFLIITSFFSPNSYLHPYHYLTFFLDNYLTLFYYSPTWIWKGRLTCVFSCPCCSY